MTEEHVFVWGQNFFGEGPVVPECTCGWEGRGVETVDDAIEEWEFHREDVYIAATEEGVEW